MAVFPSIITTLTVKRRERNNYAQSQKKGKPPKNLKYFWEQVKPNDLNRIAKTSKGKLCLREIALCLNNNYII
jgi:hypothetical protein